MHYADIWSRSPHATTLMLRVNVIHDVDNKKVKVYIDGVIKFERSGRGGASHYFKFGVYAQNDESNCMESRWKGIRVLKKKCN